jgi:hypothetical protein
MITGAIVDENRYSYSLNNLGRDYLEERKNEKLLRVAAAEWGIDPKAEMWKLPPKYVGLYAEQDAAMTLRLWERLKVELEKLDLWSIWSLETSLIPMMVDMRQMGVRVDLERGRPGRKFLRERKKYIHDDDQGQDRGVGRTVGRGLCAEGFRCADYLQYPTTDGGAPSFTKQFLTAHPHPLSQGDRAAARDGQGGQHVHRHDHAARAQRAHSHRISPAPQR